MISIDANDFLYVTDRKSQKLNIYDSFGEFHRSIGIQGGCGNDLGQFKEPIGVAVSKTGRVYVSEIGNNRVQVLY